MARVTVEDCVEKVPNRFALVLLSAHRARGISAGAAAAASTAGSSRPGGVIMATRSTPATDAGVAFISTVDG